MVNLTALQCLVGVDQHTALLRPGTEMIGITLADLQPRLRVWHAKLRTDLPPIGVQAGGVARQHVAKRLPVGVKLLRSGNCGPEMDGCFVSVFHDQIGKALRGVLMRSEERRVGKECRSRW